MSGTVKPLAGLLLVSSLVLAGCFNGGAGVIAGEEIYNPHLHLHNFWIEFDEGEVRVHTTVVNTRMERGHYTLNYGIGVWNTGNGSSWPIVFSEDIDSWDSPLPAETIRMVSWGAPLPKLGQGDYIEYQVIRYGGPIASYDSGCYRPDGDSIVKRADEDHGHCVAKYQANGESVVLTDDGPYYPLPSDPPYQELVWNCCNLRSLPAYDAYENWTLNDTQELQVTKSFPVQEGARNATVTLQLSPPEDPVKRLLPNESVVQLTVYDANDTLLAQKQAEGANGMVEVQLEELPNRGVYHAEIEAEAAEGSLVEWVVHVNDGVHPPQSWWDE